MDTNSSFSRTKDIPYYPYGRFSFKGYIVPSIEQYEKIERSWSIFNITILGLFFALKEYFTEDKALMLCLIVSLLTSRLLAVTLTRGLKVVYGRPHSTFLYRRAAERYGMPRLIFGLILGIVLTGASFWTIVARKNLAIGALCLALFSWISINTAMIIRTKLQISRN